MWPTVIQSRANYASCQMARCAEKTFCRLDCVGIHGQLKTTSYDIDISWCGEARNQARCLIHDWKHKRTGRYIYLQAFGFLTIFKISTPCQSWFVSSKAQTHTKQPCVKISYTQTRNRFDLPNLSWNRLWEWAIAQDSIPDQSKHLVSFAVFPN